MLVLLDPRFRAPDDLRYRMWVARRKLRTALHSIRDRELLQAIGRQIPRKTKQPEPAAEGTRDALERLREGHTTQPFDLPAMVVFSEEFEGTLLPTWYFESIIRQPWSWTQVQSLHTRLLLPPAVDLVAGEIRAALDQVAVQQSPG